MISGSSECARFVGGPMDGQRVFTDETGADVRTLPEHVAADGGDLPVGHRLVRGQPGEEWRYVVDSAVAEAHLNPAHWSYRVLEHAKRDPLWRVHEVKGPAPWLDRKRLEEQRRRLPESSVRRLFLNEWTSGEDRVASIEDLRACVTLDGPQEPKKDLAYPYVIGVDLGLKRDRTAVVICHGERLAGNEDPTVGARVVLDRLQVWQGSRLRPVKLDEIEEWIAAAAQRYEYPVVVLDPWQSGGSHVGSPLIPCSLIPRSPCVGGARSA